MREASVDSRISSAAAKAGVPRLYRIYFYLTSGCNLACRHCYLSPPFDPEGTARPSLSVEMFEAAIAEAKSLGLTGVKLTGGEPLLHPQIMRLLEIVRREQLDLEIETNGLMCTPVLAAEIARNPRRGVSVSLDGADAATHEHIRGVSGSFSRALQAIRNLSAAGAAPKVIMTVMRANAGQAADMVHLAETLGAASVDFNILNLIPRGGQLLQSAEALSVSELIRLGRHVDMELAPSTNIRLHFDYPPAFRPLSRMAEGGGCNVCHINDILGVNSRGHYVLCGVGELMPELLFGTIGWDRLEDVWRENGTLKALRAGLPFRLEGVCGACLLKHTCLGFCLAQNYYRTGNLWAPFWFCEEARKQGLFPPSRLGAGDEEAVGQGCRLKRAT